MSLRNQLKQVLYTQNTIRYRIEYRLLKKCLEPYAPFDCLFDGGAAAGEMDRLLLRDGIAKQVVTLEYDPNLVTKLQANLGGDSRVTIMQGSLTDVKLPDHSVDVAISTQVLEHIEDHQQAANELARIVKPGGLILISVPHPPERMPNPGHLREGYTEDELKALLPTPNYEHLHTDYFMTLATQRRMIAADEMPFHGLYMPLSWVDREANMTTEQRRQSDPFGILALFRKK